MTDAITKLFESRDAIISTYKSTWNNGEINLPVFHTEATYQRRDWNMELVNEDRDSIYHDKDYYQEYVSNHWHMRGTPQKERPYPTLTVYKNSWFKRIVLLRSAVGCQSDSKRIAYSIRHDPTLKQLLSSPFINFTIEGEYTDRGYAVWTAFSVNKFTEQKVQLAVAIIELIIDELEN